MRLIQLIFYFNIIIFLWARNISGNPQLENIYLQESIQQGNVELRRAREFFNDRLYNQCIQVLNSFSIIHPNHPEKMEAWNLLSTAYLKLGRYEASAEIDLNTYLNYPTHEDANKAYLRAGRSYTKLGNYDLSKRIYNELRDSSYFPEIAKEADLELRQWSVMSGNTRQIQENL